MAGIRERYMSTYLNFNPSKNCDFMTPKYVFEEIKEYIPRGKTIWMPFYGDGKAGQYMKELGFDVIHQPEDFWSNDHGDIVVDNPPFEKKKGIITELIRRGKPFMLIVPCSTICYNYAKILKKNVQLIIPRKRPKFIRYDKITGELDPEWHKRSVPFDCLWVCYKINLKNDINFA